ISNMLRSRAGPLLLASGIFGGLMYSTAGGKSQPRPRAMQEGGFPLSETLESIGGQGGKHARKPTEHFPGSGLDIERNTRYQSHRGSDDGKLPHAKRSSLRTD
ncbi:hypothetical protein QBC38DRAFT_367839, partial [Podospora fimiseda]